MEEAIQLKQPRFVCCHCKQMVKLCGRRTQKGKVLFFSHLYNSGDCDIKTTENLTKEEILARRYGKVSESWRHKKLKGFIAKYLSTVKSQELGISNVEESPVIASNIPYLNWRRPDIVVDFKGRKLVFELQLSTTFLSVVVERDIFYRLNNYFVVWVFNFEDPGKFTESYNFDEEFAQETARLDKHEEVGSIGRMACYDDAATESTNRQPVVEEKWFSLENLVSKDIYYANRRNVFILDRKARMKSMEDNQLYLSVTWLDETGKFVPLRLVSMEDFSFDEESCKPYYFDADQVYYSVHPEERARIAALERSKQQILQALTLKQESQEMREKVRQDELRKCKEEISRLGSCVTLYVKGQKYGYEFNGYPVTGPIYSDASSIQEPGYGLVWKNRRKGAVNRLGEEVVPCRFKDLYVLPNHTFLVEDDGEWFIFENPERIGKKKRGDVVAIQPVTSQLVYVRIRRDEETLSFVVNSNGKFHHLQGVCNLKPILSTLFFCDINGEKKLFDNDFTQLLAELHIRDVSVEDGKVRVVLKNESVGYLSESGQLLLEDEQSLENGLVAYKLFGRWGIKSSGGEMMILPEFKWFSEVGDGDIAFFSDTGFVIFDAKGEKSRQFDDVDVVRVVGANLFVFKKTTQKRYGGDGCCGLCDKYGKMLIPCKYANISYLGEGLYLTKLVQNENWHKFIYFGLADNQGKELLPCKYRSISLKNNQYVEVLDRYMYKIYDLSLNLLCRYYEIEKLTDSLSKIDVINTYYGNCSKWGIVDSSWHTVLPAKYDEIKLLSSAWIAYRKNKHWGCMSADSQQIVPCRCPNIALNKEGIPCVRIGNAVILCSEYVQIFNGQGVMELGKYYWGVIVERRVYGLMLEMENGERCLLHRKSLKQLGKTMDEFELGERVLVKVLEHDDQKKRYKISL